MSPIILHRDLAAALLEHRPVVALESAVITDGLPRTPLHRSPASNPVGWDALAPTNLELARAMQRTIADAAATPATIAILDGVLRFGLDDAELEQLACDTNAVKASSRDLAGAISKGATAGLTVSATLAALRLLDPASQPTSNALVFATGGIGGVHADWTHRPDISTDLTALATTPLCVVCAGAKSILDLPATLEALETLGIPVIGYQTDRFPHFYTQGNDALRVSTRLDSPSDIARFCNVHWHVLKQTSAVLVVNPIPAAFSLDDETINPAIDAAERDAARHGIHGRERTPYVLARVAERTEGRSLDANIALLLNNARLAAEIATAMVGEIASR